MARGALRVRMIRRSNDQVTTRAIGQARMIHLGGLPCRGGMACRTQTCKMVRRFNLGVATRAIGLPGVIEMRGLPPGDAVTIRTLPGEMIRRFFIRMATGAIGQSGMVDLGRFPHRRRVTTRAFLPVSVIMLVLVTRDAIARCAGITTVRMAFFTGHSRVRAVKRKGMFESR